MKTFLFLSLCCIAALGCASTRSTLVQRSECDQCWEAERCLDGVPITVQVPTHIRVDITEHRYLGIFNAMVDKKDAAGAVIGSEYNASAGTINWIDAGSVQAPERSVSTELVKTSKIFTVDPKRPASGTIDSTLTFGGADGQYFDQIDYKVDDKTIASIGALIATIAPKGLLGKQTSEEGLAPGESINDFVQKVDNVVASAMFSLDAPDVELQIAQFLETHLNGCHDCNAYRPIVQKQSN